MISWFAAKPPLSLTSNFPERHPSHLCYSSFTTTRSCLCILSLSMTLPRPARFPQHPIIFVSNKYNLEQDYFVNGCLRNSTNNPESILSLSKLPSVSCFQPLSSLPCFPAYPHSITFLIEHKIECLREVQAGKV